MLTGNGKNGVIGVGAVLFPIDCQRYVWHSRYLFMGQVILCRKGQSPPAS
jgi:hypothetical protein